MSTLFTFVSFQHHINLYPFIASITPGRSKQVQEKPKKRKIVVPPPPPSRKYIRLSTMPASSKGKNKAEIEVEEIKDEESDSLNHGSSKFSYLSSSLTLSLYIIFWKPHFHIKQQLVLVRLRLLKIHLLLPSLLPLRRMLLFACSKFSQVDI